jgi:hypothetical protein
MNGGFVPVGGRTLIDLSATEPDAYNCVLAIIDAINGVGASLTITATDPAGGEMYSYYLTLKNDVKGATGNVAIINNTTLFEGYNVIYSSGMSDGVAPAVTAAEVATITANKLSWAPWITPNVEDVLVSMTASDFGTTYNEMTTKTVSDPGFIVVGMAGGVATNIMCGSSSSVKLIGPSGSTATSWGISKMLRNDILQITPECDAEHGMVDITDANSADYTYKIYFSYSVG